MIKNKDSLRILNIDSRMIYSSGIGRCLREIIKNILSIDDSISINFYGIKSDYKKYLEEYEIDSKRLILIENSSRIYSISEQISYSAINLKNKSREVFYYPHYNLPYFTNENTVFTIHDFTQFKFPEYFGKTKVKIAKIILNNAVRHGKKIIVVSEATAKDFYYYFPGFKEKITVIHNGLSESFKVINYSEKTVFLKRRNLSNYLLFVGNNKPHKNIEGVLDAFAAVKGIYADLKLVVISNGFDPTIYVKDLDILNDIIHINETSEVELINFYNCAGMLIFPSYYEGFGLPLLEAMACGCPVVTSNISSMPEIAGDAALFVDPYDFTSIKEGIVTLLKDYDLRQKLISRGFERAKEFSWKSATLKYLDIFRGMVNQS